MRPGRWKALRPMQRGEMQRIRGFWIINSRSCNTLHGTRVVFMTHETISETRKHSLITPYRSEGVIAQRHALHSLKCGPQ